MNTAVSIMLACFGLALLTAWAAAAFWPVSCWLLSLRPVTDWLIRQGAKRPYRHIMSPDGTDIYMQRFWLFNPYPKPGSYAKRGVWNWLPSIRLHLIMRPDRDRHLHNHPWNARTIVLRGWYTQTGVTYEGDPLPVYMLAGMTNRIQHTDYHRITEVSDGGVWTMFFTWRAFHGWGFRVNGRYVEAADYLGTRYET